MTNQKYCMGLSQQEGLFFYGEWITSITKCKYGAFKRYDYNLRTKELKISKKERKEPEFILIETPYIHSNSTVAASIDGTRIEGCCMNNSPSGYVCLMNVSNELKYEGVMIDDKKECFGIEFYPDLSQIKYIGCYWNNERHGFGMLYDRKGELMYEGDWLFDSSVFERKVTLQVADYGFHNLIQELVIDEGCGNEFKGDLKLCGFGYLEKLVVKKKSLQNAKSLQISDNAVLKSIETEGFEESSFSSSGAFHFVKSVVISSMMIIE